MQRNSWKSVAHTLTVYMAREVMQGAYDSLRKRLAEEQHFDLHERDTVIQTMKLLAEAIVEYDSEH